MFNRLRRKDFAKFLNYIHAIFFLFITLSIVGYNTDESIAKTNVIEVEKPLKPEDLVGNVFYFQDVDDSLNIDQISQSDFQNNFKLTESEFINFGFVTSPIWLKISLQNAITSEAQLFLYLHQSSFKQFSAFQINPNGEIITITEQDETSRFVERPVANPFLVVPVDIKNGQVSDIYIRYVSESTTAAPLSIETERSLSNVTASAFAKNFIFNAMMALLFLVPAAIFIYLRHIVFFAYAASSLACLLLFMKLDGSGFQYLWPNWPQLNTQAAFIFSMVSLFFYNIFVREVLETKKRHKISDIIFLANMTVIATILFLAIFTDIPSLSVSSVILFPATYVCCIITGLIATREGFKEVRFFLAAWFMICIYSTSLMINEIFLIDFLSRYRFDIMRFVLTADVIFMGLGLLERYKRMEIVTRENLETSQQITEQNLQLAKKINALEKKFYALCQIEENQDDKLINTINDLGQQIPALRSKVQMLLLNDGIKQEEIQNFEQNFTHLEQSISETLEAASGASKAHKNAENLKDNNALLT